jgi:hypothetical protein
VAKTNLGQVMTDGKSDRKHTPELQGQWLNSGDNQLTGKNNVRTE